MNVQKMFNEVIPQILKEKPEKAKPINAIYLFSISGEKGGVWTLDLKSDPPVITEGKVEDKELDCSIELSDKDFEKMLDPKVGAQLFIQRRLKLEGDPILTTRLESLFV